MNIEIKNWGVRATEPQAKDWVKGASPIVFENRLVSGDWRPFSSSYQKQSDSVMDTNGCVSFSATASIERQINFFIVSNLLPLSTLEFIKPFLVNGKFEASDRFTTVMSRTTPEGNTGNNVAETLRTIGFCSAKTWPNLLDQSGSIDLTTYMQEPSPEAKNEALQFLKYFKIAYQFITTGLESQDLHMAPVQQFTSVSPEWFTTNPIPAFNGPMQHATLVEYVESDGIKDFTDQYPIFEKRLAADYPQPALMQIVVYPIPQPKPDQLAPIAPAYIFIRDMKFGELSQDVMELQMRLGVPITSRYDQATANAVFKFQLQHFPDYLEMIENLRGKQVGPKTREVLNN